MVFFFLFFFSQLSRNEAELSGERSISSQWAKRGRMKVRIFSSDSTPQVANPTSVSSEPTRTTKQTNREMSRYIYSPVNLLPRCLSGARWQHARLHPGKGTWMRSRPGRGDGMRTWLPTPALWLWQCGKGVLEGSRPWERRCSGLCQPFTPSAVSEAENWL